MCRTSLAARWRAHDDARTAEGVWLIRDVQAKATWLVHRKAHSIVKDARSRAENVAETTTTYAPRPAPKALPTI